MHKPGSTSHNNGAYGRFIYDPTYGAVLFLKIRIRLSLFLSPSHPNASGNVYKKTNEQQTLFRCYKIFGVVRTYRILKPRVYVIQVVIILCTQVYESIYVDRGHKRFVAHVVFL